MNKDLKKRITVETIVHAPVSTVWKRWTTPEDIIRWNNASDDWHTPHARNDLREGGEFVYRMEAKDGSMGFDFGGVYNKIIPQEFIEYTIGDGRKVEIHFTGLNSNTKVVEIFEAENENAVKLQHNGWQAILNNFKNYTESIS